MNNLTAYDFIRSTSLQGYNTLYKYDFMCISDTYFDNYLEAERNFPIPGYNLIQADHPSNTKRGGVCI